MQKTQLAEAAESAEQTEAIGFPPDAATNLDKCKQDMCA